MNLQLVSRVYADVFDREHSRVPFHRCTSGLPPSLDRCVFFFFFSLFFSRSNRSILENRNFVDSQSRSSLVPFLLPVALATMDPRLDVKYRSLRFMVLKDGGNIERRKVGDLTEEVWFNRVCVCVWRASVVSWSTGVLVLCIFSNNSNCRLRRVYRCI